MTKGNEQAFPIIGHNYIREGQKFSVTPHGGLTKREYFAALAMQGLLSQRAEYTSFVIAADDAVDFADALLAALEKPCT
jgi:hypothetical protein